MKLTTIKQGTTVYFVANSFERGVKTQVNIMRILTNKRLKHFTENIKGMGMDHLVFSSRRKAASCSNRWNRFDKPQSL